MAISRETARKRTTWARVGAGVLVAGAAAVAAIPLPAPKGDEPGTIDVKPPEAPAKPVEVAELDTLGLGSTMDAAGTIRIEPEVAAAPPKPGLGEDPVPTTAPAAAGEWKYVGSIVGPRATHAMVSIDGKQKLLAPGTELNGIKVVSVSADSLEVEEHGAKRSIKLAPRGSAWVGAPGRVVKPNMAGSPPPPPPSMGDDAERERLERERMLMEQQQDALRGKQMNPPPGSPVRPAPLPTDMAPGGTGRPLPVKGLGGAGSRH